MTSTAHPTLDGENGKKTRHKLCSFERTEVNEAFTGPGTWSPGEKRFCYVV